MRKTDRQTERQRGQREAKRGYPNHFYSFRDVAMAIIRSDQWESALRNVTYFNQAGIEDDTIAPTKGATFTTPMRRIIRKMPGREERRD